MLPPMGAAPTSNFNIADITSNYKRIYKRIKEIETVQKTVTSPSQARPLVSNRLFIFYINGFNL